MAGYDAFGLGNHDFDDGVEGLVPFIDGANFTVLASNIVISFFPHVSLITYL